MKMKSIFLVGILTGIVCFLLGFLINKNYYANKLENKLQSQPIVYDKDSASLQWTEYNKSDWHVFIGWIIDEKEHESRIYAFQQDKNTGWNLMKTEHLRFQNDRLSYVLVNYQDRDVMLINTDGLLIHTIELK